MRKAALTASAILTETKSAIHWINVLQHRLAKKWMRVDAARDNAMMMGMA
jgi:hypothetical protein